MFNQQYNSQCKIDSKETDENNTLTTLVKHANINYNRPSVKWSESAIRTFKYNVK